MTRHRPEDGPAPSLLGPRGSRVRDADGRPDRVVGPLVGAAQVARHPADVRRGPMRRLLDVWGFVPPPSVAHREVTFRTRDGVLLAATYLPGPAGDRADVPAVVVAHGFAGHRHKPAYVRLAEALAVDHAVLVADMRGHGASAGRSTLGDREALDVRAAASWLRREGHRWVGALGVSMGGTAALRAAGSSHPETFDAVCAVSAPAEFVRKETPVVQALARTMTSTAWRVVAECACNVRIARGWGEPQPAVALVPRISPTPLLLVHGNDDHFFGPEHAERLFAAAGEPRTLWHEPDGFGHAEDGFDDAFNARLVDALVEVRRHGVWPQRHRLALAA